MPTIKFSHCYKKLIGTRNDMATLLEVIYVRSELLHKPFIDYDTDNGAYPLTPNGLFLLLIFQKNETDIFTTLRKCTAENEKYYRAMIGELFTVEIEKMR